MGRLTILQKLAKSAPKAAKAVPEKANLLDRIGPYLVKAGALGGLAAGDMYLREKGRELEENSPGQEPDPSSATFVEQLYILEPRNRSR